MGNGTQAVLEPTFTGYVATTLDALVLFEACLTGVLHHVPRRPHDRERTDLVRSGSVFIYEENSSGIKRWTDGVTWSPSRILGNFLVYRELDKPFPPGEKKRAMKKNIRRPGQQTPRSSDPYARPQETTNGASYSPTTASPGANYGGGERTQQSELERALVGSLVDSYGFKENGLVKKTMSVTVGNVTHHLVSYYSMGDVIGGVLRPPSAFESLKGISPRHELTHKQSFRSPLDDLEHTAVDEGDPSQLYGGYRPAIMPGQGYVMNPQYYMPPAGYTYAPQAAPPPHSLPYPQHQHHTHQHAQPQHAPQHLQQHPPQHTQQHPHQHQPGASSGYHMGPMPTSNNNPNPYLSNQNTSSTEVPQSIPQSLPQHMPHSMQQPQQQPQQQQQQNMGHQNMGHQNMSQTMPSQNIQPSMHHAIKPEQDYATTYRQSATGPVAPQYAPRMSMPHPAAPYDTKFRWEPQQTTTARPAY